MKKINLKQEVAIKQQLLPKLERMITLIGKIPAFDGFCNSKMEVLKVNTIMKKILRSIQTKQIMKDM